MHENKLNLKININRFGHYDYKALEDNIEMLKSVLVDCDHGKTIK